MLNSDLKNDAIKRLEFSIEENKKHVKYLEDISVKLFKLRADSSKYIIQECEKYINNLSNSPKEFYKVVEDIKFSFERFNSILQSLEKKSSENNQVSTSMAGSGILAGVGFTALAPTAAMGLATTFGVASTGTAISALSGAAATNAALAWLGGGALVAGGSGMAGGSALLALAGPIGWLIGGASLVGAGIYASSKNEEIAEEANKKNIKVKENTTAIRTLYNEVDEVIKLTEIHSDGAKKQLSYLMNNAPSNYKLFNDNHKKEIMSLINNIKSLSSLLSKKIGN